MRRDWRIVVPSRHALKSGMSPFGRADSSRALSVHIRTRALVPQAMTSIPDRPLATCPGDHSNITVPRHLPRGKRLCAECEAQYGRAAKQWPEWLRFLVNDDRTMRNQRIEERSWLRLPDDDEMPDDEK